MNDRTRTALVAVLIGALASSAMSGQTARPRAQRVDPLTASIRGTVTTAGTGAPVRGAIVHLTADGGSSRLAATDVEGRFQLLDLPAGTYSLTVSRAGFSSLQFGQRRPFEAPTRIDLSEGEGVTANLALPRAGAIYGRIVDQFGEPVAGTRVQALRSRVVQGERRLQIIGAGDQTDDTGAYRLYGLAPGDYYVSASVGPVDSVKRDPPIYYPGTPGFAEAQPIPITPGAEAAADFQLAPMRMARVSGIVLNSAGAPVMAQVGLISEAIGTGPSSEPAVLAATALRLIGDSGPDGTFTIENVPPGPYTLTASLPMRAPDAIFLRDGGGAASRAVLNELMMLVPETASLPLVVSGEDVSGLTLVARSGGVLNTRFEADDGVTRPLPTGLGVSVRSERASGMSMTQTGAAAGTFRVAGMNGPFHLEIRGLPDGWAVSRITIDGDDVTDEPIDLQGRSATARIVLTDRITSVNGVVQSRGDATSHSVVVFADDEAKWTYPTRYVRVIPTDDRGRFQIAGLPPGERYLALAVDYLEDGEEQDPQFLDQLRSRATSFSLRDGERRSLQLDPVTR